MFPPFFFFLLLSPLLRPVQNNWFASSVLAWTKTIYDFSPELPAEGAKLASAHLERAKCLLHSGSMHSGDYCDG